VVISVLMGAALSAAMLQASSVVQPRQDLVTCLRTAVEQAVKDKLAKDGFAAFASGRCSGQIASFKQASMAYDVKMGTARSRAASDAESEVADHLANATDKFQQRVATVQ
jgi:hypothetical protein